MASTQLASDPATQPDTTATSAPSITVPPGFRLHTENTARILLPDEAEAFLNPVQEFNRDMSVAVIHTWSEEVAREKEARFWAAQKRKKEGKDKKAKRAKVEGATTLEGDLKDAETSSTNATAEGVTEATTGENTTTGEAQAADVQFRAPKIVILEALSATGLRSIRYAQEIPLVKHVLANDLSEHAVEAMKRNIELNELGPKSDSESSNGEASTSKKQDLGKVRVNYGDARALMYAHSVDKSRVDVVDLDPYGTAAPFIDAAVQAVNEGGLLCVTCTDLSVLATNNYPEKCFANYGGVPAKAEYCHEIALRLVLHTISQSAARYGRYIEPVLSLSIDFYVRLFVRVKTAAIQVKRALTHTSTVYVCSFCQAHYDQPMGRLVEKRNDRSGTVTELFKTQSGPPIQDNKCPECSSPLHISGPMWTGPLHDSAFVSKVLTHLEASPNKYGTAARMKGMLTVAMEELDTLFYFTPASIASHFHSVCPSLSEMASALLNDKHKISRSHACPGSLKTTATRKEVHDIFRSWIKLHPVKLNKLPDASPARVMHAKELAKDANFTKHPKSPLPGWKEKLVRYQPNPTPNWGPGSKAPGGTKRKRENSDEQ